MPRLRGMGLRVGKPRRRGKKLVGVALDEGDVPLDVDAEAVVGVAAEGEVGGEEDGEVDVGLARDAAEQRCLVLDGMADQVGEAECGGLGWRARGHGQ